MEKSRAIVYGLGEAYESSKYYLENTFDIVAYSDRRWKEFEVGGVVAPEKMKDYPHEYIYITSKKYSGEIKKELVEKYGISVKKILTVEDMWWNIENSSKRDKWIIRKLKEIPNDLTLLDAGAGNMIYKEYCDHLNYISQDFGEYDDLDFEEGLQVKGWHSKKVDIISDIVSIPLEDNSIDVILCSEVFEHIKDPIKALGEFARLIKHSGILLLTAPVCSITHMAPYYYANGFSRYWYEANLQEAGFEILEITPRGNWFTFMAQELERLPYVSKRYGEEIDGNVNKQMVEMLRILTSQVEKDTGSNELLCFGYMVKAKKK